MIAVFLCAGFATRMYPLTENQPKPLLSVGDRPVLDYLMDQVAKFPQLDAIHVVTNDRFYSAFINWRDAWLPALRGRNITLTLHNDGVRNLEQRLGSIGDLDFVLKTIPLPDGAFVAAGDNILRFDLLPVWRRFLDTGKHHVLAVKETETGKLQRAGVIEIAPDHRVLNLVEKSATPPSQWICPAHYFLHPSALRRVAPYAAEGHSLDASGPFISKLLKHEPVYAYIAPGGRFDIGDMDSYYEADRILCREPVIPA